MLLFSRDWIIWNRIAEKLLSILRSLPHILHGIRARIILRIDTELRSIAYILQLVRVVIIYSSSSRLCYVFSEVLSFDAMWPRVGAIMVVNGANPLVDAINLEDQLYIHQFDAPRQPLIDFQLTNCDSYYLWVRVISNALLVKSNLGKFT